MTAVHHVRSRFPAARVTITSKGQFSIPTRLRDALGIVPGSRVAIDLDEDGFRVHLLSRAAARSPRRRRRKEVPSL